MYIPIQDINILALLTTIQMALTILFGNKDLRSIQHQYF